MIFKKMKLTNFRQFKGELEIVFSIDKNKNVTVITGNNGAGKTTLLQAFNWCLYGQLKLEDPDQLLNKSVNSNMKVGEKAIVEVSVDFEHLNNTYTCRNYIEYIRNADGNVKKLDEDQIFTITDRETGETKRTNQNAIREIFPSDLSTYFLFDGERMQDLVDNQRIGKKDLYNAVTNLLGLEVIRNGLAHLEKAKKEFATEFVSDNTSRLSQINKELDELDNQIEQEKKNKEIYENELIDLEKKQSRVDEILKSNAGLKDLQNKRSDYDKQLERLESDIETKKRDIYLTFSQAAPKYFLGSTIESLIVKIKSSKLADKGIEGINGKAIDFLLKQEKCICGCNLELNTEARKSLEELRKYLPPESYSVLLKSLEVQINNTKENNERYYDNFYRMYTEFSELINRRDGLLNKKNDNEKLIADAGDKDLSVYNDQYIQYRNQIASKNQAIGSCTRQIEYLKNTQRNREDERSRITVTNNINDVIQFKVDICEKLIDNMQKRLSIKEKEVKNEMQIKTSELLSKMLNSGKRINIDDNYNFTVIDDYHTTTLSEGEKIVTSFAFVGAIISVAKKVLDNSDDSKFTLVMDAPFAKLDLEHRKNVTALIPNLTDQIILFSADSQWDSVVESSLKDKVGKIYDIVKIESSLSTIRLLREETV